jgi:hypothetical protein
LTLEISKKDYHIELLRKNGFNCFPIQKKQKIADHRYNASRTLHNQIIKENENYGYIPIIGTGTAIVDFDNKEKYRPMAELLISKGYMVVETPHGWHVPVTGLAGNISKIELFDYEYQPNKKIIEIQGTDHYCVGVGSIIAGEKKDNEEELLLEYKNAGTDKIWDVTGIDFHKFADKICTECNVEARKKNSNSSYKSYRDRFLKGLPPTAGTSNDYFFQSAKQCNTDDLTQNEALEKIRTVYDKWVQTDAFSDRPWSNIEAKVTEVYENDLKIETGRPNGSKSRLDRTQIAQDMIAQRLFYSNDNTHEIFENTNGFLEKINNSLKRELQNKYPEMEQPDYNAVLFKLEGLAQQMPETNKNLKVFKNGIYDVISRRLIESDEIADMGFRNYDYLLPTKENEPTKFLDIMFENVPKNEHARIKAGLKSALGCYLDPRISVTHGLSRVGKSTGLEIIVIILGEYALAVDLDQLLSDRFIRAKIKGLTFLYIQDIPQDWKDFSQIKVITGEQRRTERGFYQDSSMFDNKLKIWATGNYLTIIPENEKNAMYTSRLSLIHNTRAEPYPEDPTLIDRVVKEEGEKIISWILNLPDEECVYENSKTVRKEWEELASPEIKYLQNYWDVSEDATPISVMKIIVKFEESTGNIINIDQMTKTLHNQGFIVKNNLVSNIKEKTHDTQTKL